MLKKEKFTIGGIHCRSCKTLIETEIDTMAGVKSISVNHQTGAANIEYDDKKTSLKKVFTEITRLNYEPQLADAKSKPKEKTPQQGGLKSLLVGMMIPVAVAILVSLLILSRKFGGFEILSRLNESNVSYPIILLIGLLAGFHCVGMCGGLVVAYSAKNLKEDKKQGVSPHLLYNLGRLISYTIIGGILGGIGSFFGINPSFTGTVIIFASIFMILMGMSFIFDWKVLQKIKLRTPDFIARFLFKNKNNKKSKGPFIIGLLNGFMPCGPLQSMQLYALTTGSIIQGSTSMAFYALGTIPLMFGFGTVLSSIGNRHIKKILKFSGALIIILGIFMANRGLANFGYGFRSFSFSNTETTSTINNTTDEFQTVNMDLTYLGYKPNILYIQPDIPVRWVINVKEMTGCTNSIMIESLGIKKDLVIGENIIEFIPPASGEKEIKFSCWMRMVWGKFVITDSKQPPSAQVQAAQAKTLPQGTCDGSGSCGGGCGSTCGCGR